MNAERDAGVHANGEAGGEAAGPRPRRSTSQPAAAQAAVRAITDKWDVIGKTPGTPRRSFDVGCGRSKKIRDAADAGRIDPEAQARAEQFRSRAEQSERQAEKLPRQRAGTRRPTRRAGQRGAVASSGRAAAAQAVAKRRWRRHRPSRKGGSGGTGSREKAVAAAQAVAKRRCCRLGSAGLSSPSSSERFSRSTASWRRWGLSRQLQRGAGPHHARPVKRQQYQ